MEFYIKEWSDESVSLINSEGQTLWQFIDVYEAEDAVKEWDLPHEAEFTEDALHSINSGRTIYLES